MGRCLERTRSAVLNVLVGVGLTIATAGWLLRGREPRPGPLREAGGLHDVLMVALIVLAVASYLVRRSARRRSGLRSRRPPQTGSTGRTSWPPRSPRWRLRWGSSTAG